MKAGQLINGIIVLLVSAAVFVGTFFLLSEDEYLVQEGWIGSLNFDEPVDSTLVALTARLNGRDALSLIPGSVADFAWNEEANHLDVNLDSGGLAYAAIAGDFSISVNTGYARVDSQNSSGYVEVLEGETNIYAVEHPSLVTFVLDGDDLNSISVPTDYRMKVPESKISETIGRLRLTKLSKEFPIYEIGDLEDEVEDEVDEMNFVYTENMTDFVGAVLAEGNYGPPRTGVLGQVSDVYEDFRSAVTFMPHAEARYETELQENLLSYAISNLLYGSVEDGEFWLSAWKDADHDMDELRSAYAALFFAMPGSELYPVKAALADVLYEGEDAMTFLRLKYLEIETLLAGASKVSAEEAYGEYKNEFKAALNSGVFDGEEWLPEISREYMLLELMLRNNSIFYTVDDAALLADLEEKILTLTGSDQDLDEEKQAFVQSKLRFLGNLFSFVVDKKISVDAATELADELLYSAESYLNSISAASAVQEYYESSLEEYELSADFMGSAEFYSYSDFDEGLEAYRLKVADLDELNEYIQNLRSGDDEEVSEISFDEAYAEVEEDFLFAGITYSELVSLGDTAYRLFEIQGGHVGGYAFEANYDRETRLLYDVVAEDARFSTGILLDSIRDVIETALEEEEIDDDDGNDDAVVDTGSSAENLALDEAREAFEELGLNDFSVELMDLDANLFTFEGIITQYSLSISGAFDLISGQVTEISWEVNGEVKSMPDLDLSELESAIEVTAQALLAD
jgi:hypothetical protein